MTAPLLVIAVGNPARGDDGLGPALLELLDTTGLDGVESLVEFQLQVEHALDLAERKAVLFIDASRTAAGVELTRVTPAEALPTLSHALTPSGVLHVARRLGQGLPEAWQLAIEGASFELGAGLSDAARSRLPRALDAAQAWLAERRSPRRACGVASDGVARPGDDSN